MKIPIQPELTGFDDWDGRQGKLMSNTESSMSSGETSESSEDLFEGPADAPLVAKKPATDKPAEKPPKDKAAAKPAKEKPAAKAAEKPAAKPAKEKPAAKPAEKPAAKPDKAAEKPKAKAAPRKRKAAAPTGGEPLLKRLDTTVKKYIRQATPLSDGDRARIAIEVPRDAGIRRVLAHLFAGEAVDPPLERQISAAVCDAMTPTSSGTVNDFLDKHYPLQ